MGFKAVRNKMAPEHIEKALAICKDYNLDPSKYEVRITSSRNIALSQNNIDVYIFKKDGTPLSGAREEIFTEVKVAETEKSIKDVLGSIFDIKIKLSPDKKILTLHLISKAPFLQQKNLSFQYSVKSKIMESLKQKIGLIKIIGDERKRIDSELKKIKKQFSEITITPVLNNEEKRFVSWFNSIEKSEIYFSTTGKANSIIHNGYTFPYSTFFSSKNKLKKDFKLKEKIKDIRKKEGLNKKYNQIKEYYKDNNDIKISLNKGKVNITYKGKTLSIKLDDPYKAKIKKFIKNKDASIEAKIKQAEEAGLAGSIIAVAICSILEGGTKATEKWLINLLRGLKISDDFLHYNKKTLKTNIYLGKFNKIPNEEISKTIENLRTNGFINKSQIRGAFCSFSVYKSSKNTKFILDTTNLNEFALIKEILAADDVKEFLPSLIAHPACYYFSSEVQSKLRNIDEKTHKYLKVLYKIEDDKTKKKLIKTITDNRGIK